MDSADDVDTSNPPLLTCVVEQLRGGMGHDERVNIGMIVICPSTGDVVWDEFEGRLLGVFFSCYAESTFRWPHAHRTRSKFVSIFQPRPFMSPYQTRMVHCKPAELLLADQGLTQPTERMLKHFAGFVLWTLPMHKC